VPVLASNLVVSGALVAVVVGACSSGTSTATKPLTLHAMGQDIVVPVPPGMRRFAVDASGLRHQYESIALRREGPYYATAMMRGPNEQRARRFYDDARLEQAGQPEGEALGEWTEAMRQALAGQHGPLPHAPDGFVLFDRDTSTAGTVINLVHLSNGDDRNLVADAMMIVHQRGLGLAIVMKQPADLSEIAALRVQIREWVRAIRAANP
jgi:hypothetical protein